MLSDLGILRFKSLHSFLSLPFGSCKCAKLVNATLSKLTYIAICQWSKRSTVYIIVRSLLTGLLSADALWIIPSLSRLWQSLEAVKSWALTSKASWQDSHYSQCRCPATQNATEQEKSPAVWRCTVSTLKMAEVQRYEFTSHSTSYDFIRKRTRSQLNQCEDRSSYEILSWQDYIV